MKTKHTETPWKVKGNNIDIMAPDVAIGELLVAKVTHDGHDALEVQANAQFIIKAVNNHDALVEALQKLVLAVDPVINSKALGLEPFFVEPIKQAWLAIANATKED